MTLQLVQQLDEHPIPLVQSEIDEVWQDVWHPDRSEPPSVDEAHEEYARTIAEWGEWYVFRPQYPFESTGVVFWNRAAGEGFVVEDDEGNWHEMVNVFAEIVEAQGDCRDADYSSSLRQSGAYNQRCKECGQSWSVG